MQTKEKKRKARPRKSEVQPALTVDSFAKKYKNVEPAGANVGFMYLLDFVYTEIHKKTGVTKKTTLHNPGEAMGTMFTYDHLREYDKCVRMSEWVKITTSTVLQHNVNAVNAVSRLNAELVFLYRSEYTRAGVLTILTEEQKKTMHDDICKILQNTTLESLVNDNKKVLFDDLRMIVISSSYIVTYFNDVIALFAEELDIPEFIIFQIETKHIHDAIDLFNLNTESFKKEILEWREIDKTGNLWTPEIDTYFAPLSKPEPLEKEHKEYLREQIRTVFYDSAGTDILPSIARWAARKCIPQKKE